MELDGMVKRRRNDNFGDTTTTSGDELRIEDLRHESLNQILKQNMEILKLGRGNGFDDDDLDNNNDSLSGESLLNGVGVNSDSNNNAAVAELHQIIGSDGSGPVVSKLNADDDDSDAVLNQLIDDEQNSVNGDDDVS